MLFRIAPRESHWTGETDYCEKHCCVLLNDCWSLFLHRAMSGPSSFLRSLREVLMPLRKAMASSENKFDGTFLQDCQVMPVPLELLTLVNLFIDGPNTGISNFSQPSLTDSQLILSNFKQKYHSATNPKYWQSNRQVETPIQIYPSLEPYSIIRSKNLIDQLFKLDICSSYEELSNFRRVCLIIW